MCIQTGLDMITYLSQPACSKEINQSKAGRRFQKQNVKENMKPLIAVLRYATFPSLFIKSNKENEKKKLQRQQPLIKTIEKTMPPVESLNRLPPNTIF